MPSWVTWALLATFTFGFWGYFPRLATQHLEPRTALLYQNLGTLLSSIVLLAVLEVRLTFHPRGVLFSVLTGVAGTVGTLFMLMAVNKGQTSVVIPLTAMYPVITVLLAALTLEEPITPKQFVGLGLSLVAIYLMSSA